MGGSKARLPCGAPSGPYVAPTPAVPLVRGRRIREGRRSAVGGWGRGGRGGGALLTNDFAAHSGVLCRAEVYRATLHYDILRPNRTCSTRHTTGER